MANKSSITRLSKTSEALRQERETFEQLKKHDQSWFALRLVMGYAAVIILITIPVISGVIIFNYKYFPDKIVSWAGPALFIDVLGIVFTIWKVVLHSRSDTKLGPITKTGFIVADKINSNK